MAKQIVDIGALPNDGTGDSLRDAYDKCNDNFTEIYSWPNPTTVSATTYDVLAADRILHVTRTATGTCGITVPSALITTALNLVIKDGAGNSSVYNITIATEGAETIDGAATATINSDYSAINIYSNGTNLFIY